MRSRVTTRVPLPAGRRRQAQVLSGLAQTRWRGASRAATRNAVTSLTRLNIGTQSPMWGSWNSSRIRSALGVADVVEQVVGVEARLAEADLRQPRPHRLRRRGDRDRARGRVDEPSLPALRGAGIRAQRGAPTGRTTAR